MLLEKLITEQETAGYLNISPETLKKARFKGTGPDYIKVGRCIRYRMSAVVSYLERHTITHQRGI